MDTLTRPASNGKPTETTAVPDLAPTPNDFVLRWSPTRAKIAEALIEAQKKMHVVRAGIEADLGRGGKYKYADLANVLDVVLAPLNNAGIALVQGPEGHDEAEVRVETTLQHVSGEYVTSILKMAARNRDGTLNRNPQGAGSAITYARRYAVLSMCGIATEDDDARTASGYGGGNGGGQQRQQRSNERPATARNNATPPADGEPRPMPEPMKTNIKSLIRKLAELRPNDTVTEERVMSDWTTGAVLSLDDPAVSFDMGNGLLKALNQSVREAAK